MLYRKYRTEPSANAKFDPPGCIDQKWNQSQGLSVLPGPKSVLAWLHSVSKGEILI